jgi:glycosyltransferase involved in cell wall biosynthesis
VPPIIPIDFPDQYQQEMVPEILHLGTMSWLPNIEGVLWFIRSVWPIIKASNPNTHLTIAGKNPPPEIKALSEETVTVTGYVSDPTPYLRKTGVFIVPLISGSGMRVKILDAWRWGLPTVSTSLGAEGILYKDNENILIADHPLEFADATLKILTQPELRNSLRVNGRRWVEEHYDWQKIYPAWDCVYTR